MPACNKDSHINDVLALPEEAHVEHIEKEYQVNIHPEGEGGLSHTEERHSHTGSRNYLEHRLKTEKIEAATKFVSKEALRSSRHRWLETFSAEMHGVMEPQDGDRFSARIEFRDSVGVGIQRDGAEIKEMKKVVFVYEWRTQQKTWCEITGYPTVSQEEPDVAWHDAI